MTRRTISCCIAVAASGCVGSVDDWVELRVEPPSGELRLDLQRVADLPPATLAFRVIGVDGHGDDHDVTAWARFEPIDRALGDFAGGTFTSAAIAGAARVAVSLDAAATDLSLTVRIHSTRLAAGATAAAPGLFAAALDEPGDPRLEPGDGAVLPPSLGALSVELGALDDDDLHEIRIATPFLELLVYAPGAPGPRTVALTPAEWDAVRGAARGDAIDLTARSLRAAAPALARRTDARIGITDRDLSGALLYGVVPLDPTAADDTGVWRYDLVAAAAAPWYAKRDRPDGRCVGCHVTASPDGRRIAITTIGGGAAASVILDAATREQLSVLDPAVAWSAAAFAPDDRLVTAWQGVLTVRDATTAAPTATLPVVGPAVQPAFAPDGATLAYAVADDATAAAALGADLVVHPWDAATATIGPPRVVVPRTAGGIKLPTFSPDGAWIVYSRTASRVQGTALAGAAVVAVDGSAAPVTITEDPHDGLARWITAPAPTRVHGRVEAVAWLAIASRRDVGARAHDDEPQLWLVPFFPDRAARGEAAGGRPIHLPGQPAGAAVRHAPLYVP